MLSDAQQVAIIQTLLHFIGQQSYAPSAAQVLAQLQAFNQQAAGGGSIGTGKPVPAGWDVAKNAKV